MPRFSWERGRPCRFPGRFNGGGRKAAGTAALPGDRNKAIRDEGNGKPHRVHIEWNRTHRRH
jgi:hypothetical protein